MTNRSGSGMHGPLRARSGDAMIWEALRDLQAGPRRLLASQAGSSALWTAFSMRALPCSTDLAPLERARLRRLSVRHDGRTRSCRVHSIASRSRGDSGRTSTRRHRGWPIASWRPCRADGCRFHGPVDAALVSRQVKPQEIALLLDGATPDPPLPDRRLCDIGRIYLDTLRALPRRTRRQRVYGLAAELLARS